jgi:hypothetical protein
MMENDLWYSIEGKVASITDGRTILVALADDHHLLRVHVAGIALERRGSFPRQAKALVKEMALSKPVGIMVNPSKWVFLEKRPAEVTA